MPRNGEVGKVVGWGLSNAQTGDSNQNPKDQTRQYQAGSMGSRCSPSFVAHAYQIACARIVLAHADIKCSVIEFKSEGLREVLR